MAVNDLTTLANVKAWLKLPATANTDLDPLLLRLISAASAFIQTALDRTFAVTAYTESRDGKGTTVMLLKDYPVISVTAVTVDAMPVPPAADCTKPGFVFGEKSVGLNGYKFTRGLHNVQISYSSGYATVPLEIEQVAIDLIAKKYKGMSRIGLRSEVLNQQTTYFDVQDINDEIKSVLKQYAKVVPL